MGTYCAPLLADLFLHYYEADFTADLIFLITTDTNGEYICQSKVRNKVLCQKERLNINCERETGDRTSVVLFIKSNFDRKGHFHCTHWFGVEHFDCDDMGKSLRILNKRCGGRPLCYLKVTKDLFGNPCLGITKYLDVSYCCTSVNYKIPVTESTEDTEINYYPTQFSSAKTTLHLSSKDVQLVSTICITVGVVVVVICSLIAVGVLRRKRQIRISNNTQRLTEHTDNYIHSCNEQQSMVLPERSRTNEPFQTIGSIQHRIKSHTSLENGYEEIEIMN